MRILVATDQWFPDFRGGSARVACETARGLARRGHDVTVLAPRVDGLPHRAEEGSLVVLRSLRRGPFPKTITDVAESARCAAAIRSQNFDVTIAHQSTVSAGLRAARLGVPTVLVFHASALRELRFRRSRLAPGFDRLVTYGLEGPLALLEQVAARGARRIVVLSEFSRSLLREDHPHVAEKAVRIPGGVDVDHFAPGDGKESARARLGLPAQVPLLVTVRRLVERMGVEELLKALALLGDDGPSLGVVGSGPLEPRLRQISKEQGVENRVLFLGRVADDVLPDWYRAADLFVLPTVAYEGFGMVTLEALACGAPVVGTAVGATPEILAPLDERLLSESPEPAILAAAIARGLGLADEGFRRRCREYACERFSWDRVVEEWEGVLAKVCGS